MHMQDGAGPYPWIRIVRRGDRWAVDGSLSASFGHKIERPGGKPDGVYWEWNWDGQRLTIENDRYGLAPLFYHSSPDCFLASPSLLKLIELGAPTELDYEGLAVFFRLSTFIAEDTAFRAIRALPPNATAIWQDGQLSLRSELPPQRCQRLSREQAMDGYIELFRQAIKRRPPPSEQTVVPLSGGRDSRHILLELMRAGHPPKEAATALHWRPQTMDDVGVAAEVAGRLGIQHVTLNPTQAPVAAETHKNLLTHLCAGGHAQFLPVAERYAGQIDCIYDGFAGGLLSAGDYLSEQKHRLYEAGRLSELAAAILPSDEDAVRAITTLKEYLQYERDVCIEKISNELCRYQHAGSPISSFFFWTRGRRHNAPSPFGLSAGVKVAYVPFADHDLFDFLTSLPAELLWDHDFHTDTIARAFPEHSDLPYSSGSGGPGLWQSAQSTVGLLAYCLGRAPRRLGRLSSGLAFSIRKHLQRRPLGFNWRSMVYLLQLEALSSPGSARAALQTLEPRFYSSGCTRISLSADRVVAAGHARHGRWNSGPASGA